MIETQAPADDAVVTPSVAPPVTQPAEDEDAASGEDEAVAPVAAPEISTDSPVDSSLALPVLPISPAPAPQPAVQTVLSTALLASAVAETGALPNALAPAVGDETPDAEAPSDAAARQAAAAQALAAALPASKALLRPVDAAPIKDAPANASTSAAPETAKPAPQGPASNPVAQGTPTAEISGQAATPGAPQAAVAPIATVEAAANAAVPTGPVAAAPAPAPTVSAPPAPVIVTNASNLSQVTVETTVQIAAQITRKLEGRSTRFEMGMTPEGLGRVDISLDIDAGGKLTARLAFDNPLAATEMRGRADDLRRELQNAGFTIANDGLNFSERQASSDGGFDRRQGRAFAGASRINADADMTQPNPAAWVSLSLTPRGVDMKV